MLKYHEFSRGANQFKLQSGKTLNIIDLLHVFIISMAKLRNPDSLRGVYGYSLILYRSTITDCPKTNKLKWRTVISTNETDPEEFKKNHRMKYY